MEPPGPRQQQHNNQTMDKRVGAQVARGDCMGGHSDLPFLPCCYYAKKWVVWGWLRWFRTSALFKAKKREKLDTTVVPALVMIDLAPTRRRR
jgi:hypothetical protein